MKTITMKHVQTMALLVAISEIALAVGLICKA